MSAPITTLRIGNCSGFLGDRGAAARELLAQAELDVLTGDWLAELTMIILQKQRERDPAGGYAKAFLDQLEEVLGTCIDRGVRIVSNAGGLNPGGCAEAINSLAERLGLSVSIGYVDGDDLHPRIDELIARGALRDFASGEPLDLEGRPTLAANAYMGGWAVTEALLTGADVVVTGRITDASLVSGPAAWAFRWRRDDWDLLAGAVVAGHVIECGGQATGGNFSFFDEVPGMERIGFPIAEIHDDGTSTITKTETSGGIVTRETITAQLLYEIQSLRYLNPDVTVHLDSIELDQEAPDRVRISRVIGSPPSIDLKVSLAISGGYRNSMMLALTGLDVEGKARVAENAIWAAVPGGRQAFDAVEVEVIGRPRDDPETFGAGTALLRIAVAGPDEQVVGRGFSSAVIETGLCSYPGFFPTSPPSGATSYAIYRPALIDAAEVTATVHVNGTRKHPRSRDVTASPDTLPATSSDADDTRSRITDSRRPSTRDQTVRRPIGTVLGARSGDKGGDANLGVWARNDDVYAWLESFLTVERLRGLLPETDGLQIDRYQLPRLRALNFVLRRFLGDGVSACLRFDNQAKGLAEYFRSRYVEMPVRLSDGQG